MIEGMREQAFQLGIELTVMNLPNAVPPGYDLDGHVVLTPAIDDKQTLLEAVERGARFIILGSDYPDNSSLPCVNADTRAGTREAVELLIKAGHRRIGLIGVLESFPNYQREIEGYFDALKSVGLPVIPGYILSRSPEEQNFRGRIIEWLNAHREITAVFAADYAASLAPTCFRAGSSQATPSRRSHDVKR